jgi:hypothetical protein
VQQHTADTHDIWSYNRGITIAAYWRSAAAVLLTLGNTDHNSCPLSQSETSQTIA